MDEYPKGSLVLVQNTWLEVSLNKFKLNPRYLGPFEVVSKTKRGNYILKELDGAVHSEPYAGFWLIQYIKRDNPLLQEYSLEDVILENQKAVSDSDSNSQSEMEEDDSESSV